jgi:hypothetical protein
MTLTTLGWERRSSSRRRHGLRLSTITRRGRTERCGYGWSVLMSAEYKGSSKRDLLRWIRIRTLPVFLSNSIMATDLFDGELIANRNTMVGAFSPWTSLMLHCLNETNSTSRSSFMEHVMQAYDISHTMQLTYIVTRVGRNVFRQWASFDAGRLAEEINQDLVRGERSKFL